MESLSLLQLRIPKEAKEINLNFDSIGEISDELKHQITLSAKILEDELRKLQWVEGYVDEKYCRIENELRHMQGETQELNFVKKGDIGWSSFDEQDKT